MTRLSSVQSPPRQLLPRLALWLALGLLLFAAVRLAFFWPQGPTANYLANRPSLQVPVNQFNRSTAQALDAVNIDIWFLPAPRVFVPGEIFAERLERGGVDGSPVYNIEFSEAGLNEYLYYWFGWWAEENLSLRNTYMDLKPGGLIVYGDVNLGTDWQKIGALFELDASGRQFVFVGVDIDGQLLAAPPAGPIADGVTLLAANGNRALRELKFIDAEGDLYIRQIVLSEDGAQIIAR